MEELDKSMYYGANPETIGKAKTLRKKMTEAEKILWHRLKGKQMLRLRFRRQHPVDIFIADFYCHTAKQVIELDGEIHNEQSEYDKGRDAEMNRFDIEVIRFKNREILSDIESALERIQKVVDKRIKSPPWGI